MLLDCPSDAPTVDLPHRCPNAAEDAPIPYTLGPGARARLNEGETLPVTARCHRCGGRAFVSLVDPAARERRIAQVRPDPTVLRTPSERVERVRRFAGPSPAPIAKAEAEPCPACGQVPDSFGHCRCSA